MSQDVYVVDVYVVIEHLLGQVADISYLMLAAARALAQGTGGKVVAVLLGHDVPGLANDLAADRVLYVDHPDMADFSSDACQRVLEALIGEHRPRAVLFGDTSMGADVAAWLAARLNLPLVSSCYTFKTDGAPKFVGQIYGGKIIAEGDLPGPTVLVAMVPGGFKAEQGKSTAAPEVIPTPTAALDGLRVRVRNYIEPAVGDVDVAKEPILVAVGRGIQNQDNIDLAKDLAKVLGGEVCGSRPVIDQGWLPTSRLVGKSGKHVKPKVYLALGISGAPEHIEGIGDSEMIVAINTDPAAPIFNVARYGALVDLFDLLPALTEQVQQAKGR
ncbi:MAG: electron transfer flavoprotein subunit alpha/FixB family protein [Chloroflexota bacterium]|nr:electron transfer flavoprotein subunit alpha/FixB family protein [Chloroflexota bacterium]